MARPPAEEELLARWRTETDFDKRDEILDQLIENDIFPGKDQETYEREGGLYPDLKDPEFLAKLIRKREFQESKQPSIKESMEEGIDRCRTTEDFEITSVQRFVNRLLSPRTPYHSALLFHGVGVGKTCAAVTVAESYLQEYPGKKVYVVAPPNIQEGFRRTIFDVTALSIAKGVTNKHRGCTGNLYLELTGSLEEQNRPIIESRVTKAVKGRYEFFGYTSFYNHIVNLLAKIPKATPPDRLEEVKRVILRNEFSNRVLIIDEAHNLRDNPLEPEDDSVDDTTPSDSADAKAGKKLTPFLKEVLEVAEGVTLLLMTATPMYNSFVEIVFLLNLLLINDKFERMRVDEIFDMKRQRFMPGGEKLLGKVAGQYISFMRGENPLTFPIRLEPMTPLRIKEWARVPPKGEGEIDPDERSACVKLPCIGANFSPESEELYKEQTLAIVGGGEGMGITNTDILVQAGNWLFPGDSDDFLGRIRQQGFDSTFTKEKRGSLIYFKNTDEERGASWLLEANLPSSSGKCAVLLDRLNHCRGVAFVYSRFVASGALAIALALEANGYTCWNRDIGFLAEGNQHPDGRQCALCPRKERGHGQVPEEAGTPSHTFKPAKYILLTGSEELSPNNARSIDAVRASSNVYGQDVKVVLGSQIAGEGLDLRYIREVLVYDSWYHLNKLEQVVGRGIRNCSHATLVKENKNNCTVILLVNSFASQPDMESIDMYSYRQALKKAIVVGRVTRVLKEYAIDCSLNRDAILVKGLDPVRSLLDSQGVERKDVLINDVPLTPMCDWLETCEYDCKYGDGLKMITDIPLEDQDTSTYDEYTARFQMNRIKNYLRDRIVKGTPFVTFEKIQNDFSVIPVPLLRSLLSEIIEQKEIITGPVGMIGKIIIRNGYYIFQPDQLKDQSIPIALRTVSIPIHRDIFLPKVEPLIKSLDANYQNAEEDTGKLWELVLAWASTIRDGSAEEEPPGNLVVAVSNLRESAGVSKAQQERLTMVVSRYDKIKEREETRDIYADIVLEYMWDEFVPVEKKRELMIANHNDPVLRKVAAESYIVLDGNTYIRLIDSKTNVLEYLCIDAEGAVAACSRAIVEVLEREQSQDPLISKPIDIRSTGYEYGFINYNPKKKMLVFKKNKPPMPKAKLTRGSECSINSGTSYEIKLLERFGTLLASKGKNSLGLEGISGEKITNSVRVCTVCDLTLRYMDKMAITNKRWFYRPIESKLYAHPFH
jgi:hypothetical protein